MINLVSLLISISRRSLVTIWVGIEVSILSFLLILITSNLFQEHNNTVKYFLFQSICSILLLLRLRLLGEIKMFRIIIIIIKLGIAPFHLWFISLMKNITILSLIWLSVLQKIIPLRFIVIIKGNGVLISILGISLLMSVIYIIIQTKLINIIGASSVYSIAWVSMGLISREQVMWHFFLLYCAFQMFTLRISFIVSVTPFKTSFPNSFLRSNIILFASLNIAGFPPSPLFFIKISIITESIARAHLIISLVIIISARVVMYNYINMRMILFTRRSRKSGN